MKTESGTPPRRGAGRIAARKWSGVLWGAGMMVAATVSAQDVVISPAPGAAVELRSEDASRTLLRAEDAGDVLLPTTPDAADAANPLCIDAADGRLGPCPPGTGNGLPGPQGEPGPIGPSGPAGAAGAAGTAGPTGPAGSQGPAGDPGPAGSQGPAGNPGPAGSQGPAGAAAPAGAINARLDAYNSRPPGTYRLTGEGLLPAVQMEGTPGWTLLPRACTQIALRAATLGTPAAGDAYTFSVAIRSANGITSASGAACTLASATTACNATAAVSLVAGDAIAIHLDNNAAIHRQSPQGATLLSAGCE